eukprot:8186137-Pyramimonas_sp.AAC.1
MGAYMRKQLRGRMRSAWRARKLARAMGDACPRRQTYLARWQIERPMVKYNNDRPQRDGRNSLEH